MKVLITATLTATLLSGALTNDTEAASNKANSLTPAESTIGMYSIPNDGSVVIHGHGIIQISSLNDGWYEKWYKYTDGAGTHYMVKTYDSNGNLKRTRYI